MTAFARGRIGTGPRASLRRRGRRLRGVTTRTGAGSGDTGGVRTDPALVEAIQACNEEWDPTRSPGTAGFDALLERWPGDPVALVAVGDAYDECGGTEKAIDHYRSAMAGLDGTL